MYMSTKVSQEFPPQSQGQKRKGRSEQHRISKAGRGRGGRGGRGGGGRGRDGRGGRGRSYGRGGCGVRGGRTVMFNDVDVTNYSK